METPEERKEREAALCREALEALGGVVVKPRPTGYYWVQQWLRWPWEGWRPPEIALWLDGSWRFCGSEEEGFPGFGSHVQVIDEQWLPYPEPIL